MVVRKESCYALRFAGGRLGWLLWIDGQRATVTSPKTDWQPGRWHHVAGTLRRPGACAGSMERRGWACVPKTGLVDAAATSCYVGGGQGQPALAGAIDQVRIYPRARFGRRAPAFVPAWAGPGAAADDASDGQPGTVGGPVGVDRLHGVLGAAREVAAARRAPGPGRLVGADHADEEQGGGRSCLGG